MNYLVFILVQLKDQLSFTRLYKINGCSNEYEAKVRAMESASEEYGKDSISIQHIDHTLKWTT